jgi:uncharacterized membrane protein
VLPSDEHHRPATLTVALVLTALTGLANILVGVVAFPLTFVGVLPNRPDLSTTTLLVLGATYVLLGAATVVGALGLLVDRPRSRGLVTGLMALRIAVACISFAVVGTWYSAGSVVGIVVALVVITLLWDSRANAYFHATP